MGAARPRVVHATFQLLDRQLIDRAGVTCGKVDDLELEEQPDGTLHVTAILTGGGALLGRAGRDRLGAWMRRFVTTSWDWRSDPCRIPFGSVTELTDHVAVDVDHQDLATFAVERWVRDHVIEHLPGSDQRADG